MPTHRAPPSVVRYILATERPKHVALVALVVGGIGLGLVPVHLLRVLIDVVIPQRQASRLGLLAVALVAAALAKVAVEYRKALVAESLRQAVIGRLRSELHAHVLRLGPGFFARHPVGDLMNRVQNETGRLGMSVGWIFVDPLVEGATLLIYSAYLLSMDARLFALAATLAPPAALLAPRINAKLAEASRAFTATMGAYGARLQESLANAGEIQAHGTWKLEEARVDRAQADVVAAWMRVTRLTAALGALADTARGVGPVLVYAVGGLLAIRAGLPVGRVVAFGAMLGALYGAFDKLLKYPPQLRVAQDRYDELRALLDEPAAYVDGAHAAPLARDAVALALESVTFEHEPGRPVVDELSLAVRAGEHVALVGPSGCGKSTALGLLCGRLQPSRGVVRVGAAPLADLPLAERAARIGVASQQAVVFAGTLRDNLLYALLRHEAADPGALAAWVDPEINPEAVADDALLALCADVGLADDLVEFGLQACVPASRAAPFAPARAALAGATAPPPWDDAKPLRENLLPAGWDAGDPEADAAALRRLRDALDAHGLADAVRRLALDRDVGERGARLSGGQRQKVALARVLLKRPAALLLDEVTASLDRASARRVVALVRTWYRGRTVVAVTHDLAAVEAFDRVVVMEQGRVVEEGTRDALLARDGLFRRLSAPPEATAPGGEA